MANPKALGPRPSTHIRDGVAVLSTGVAGWAITPMLGYPGWAAPTLACGVLTGLGVITHGQISARRAEILNYLNKTLAPALGVSSPRGRRLVKAKGWTLSWPGHPRRVVLRYGTGRLKAADEQDEQQAPGPKTPAKVLDIGEPRWANEVARQVSTRLGADYDVDSNDPVKGRLALNLRTKPRETPAPEPLQVTRSKKLVNELLANTATITKVVTDETTGDVRRLEVNHQVGAKLAAAGYQRRVERTVSVMLPGRWRAKWDLEGDSVVFEVRPSLPDSLWIPPLEIPDTDPLKNYRSVKIPYGVDEDGEIISWSPAVTPQWLVIGPTGSGKTSTAHGILCQITQFGWPVWVADGKGIEFLGFQDWPNVQIVASRIEEQIAVIHRAWQLMQTRYDLVVQRRARTEDFEPLIVFIDEFSDLKANLTNWYAGIRMTGKGGDPSKPPTLSEIGSIARKGRTARVHLVVSMQRPDQDFFAGVGGDTRDNFGMRTSMGPLSPQGAEMMWGNQVTGVALPRGKVGRAIGINKNGLPVEMQAYRVPDPKESVEGTEEYELLQKLRPAESGHERLVIVPPEIDWEAEEPVELRFHDYAEAEWAKASERPDLDPLTWEQDAALHDGRSLSSAMALFGLDGEKPLGPGVRSIAAAGSGGGDAADDGSTSSGYEADDIYVEGYDQPVSVLVSTLAPGHLVCVDSEIDAWAVVEEEPVEDISDPESLVIAWRDDQDNSGELSLPVGSFVQARRPSELAMA